MALVIGAIAEAARKSAAETTKSGLETRTFKGLDETAAEAREAIIGENGLAQQIDSIKSETIEAVAARNEAKLGERIAEANHIVVANHIAGVAREATVRGELAREYPAEAGYHIEPECYLRNKEGRIVLDPQTGEARRIDYAVIKDGEVVRSVEVTSETADKTAQMAKETRIREAGGDFIQDRRTGKLVPVPSGVTTEIVRRA